MALLIDGHNVIGTGLIVGVSLADQGDEIALVRLLRRYRGRLHENITVVFDSGMPAGYSRELSGGGVEVLFSRGRGEEADDIIIRRIRRAAHPATLKIVSSDGRIVQAAEARGCQVMRSEAFAASLQQPLPALGPTARREKPLPNEKDVEEWLLLFSEE